MIWQTQNRFLINELTIQLPDKRIQITQRAYTAVNGGECVHVCLPIHQIDATLLSFYSALKITFAMRRKKANNLCFNCLVLAQHNRPKTSLLHERAIYGIRKEWCMLVGFYLL